MLDMEVVSLGFSFGKEVFVSELEAGSLEKTQSLLMLPVKNGKFNGRGYIGETMISGHQKYDYKNGAAAYIGGSVDISWDPPAIFAQGISAAIEEKLTLEIGHAMFEGFLHLIEMHHDVDDLVDHFEWTHLQGIQQHQLNNLLYQMKITQTERHINT